MNDIWALPSGEWIVYSDEAAIIRDLQTLAELEVVTSYHGIFKKHRAVQFRFQGGEDLLKYVCFVSGFNHSQVLRLLKHPGTRYNDMFVGSVHQYSLFNEAAEPRRKKKKKQG